jgi:hypothetical protein
MIKMIFPVEDNRDGEELHMAVSVHLCGARQHERTGGRKDSLEKIQTIAYTAGKVTPAAWCLVAGTRQAGKD